jgi:hypothetical protein
MAGYWKSVIARARKEAFELARWDSPARLAFSAGPVVVSGIVTWMITKNWITGAFVSLGVVAILALTVFVLKLVTLPSRMAAEAEAKNVAEVEALKARLHSEASAMQQAEIARRHQLLARLNQLYMLSNDGISLEMAAGLDAPPRDWLNAQLAKHGETWRV